MRKVRVRLTHMEKNKFKAEVGERIDNALLLKAIGSKMHKDWQLAKELQEFHVMHCPCRCPCPTDCNYFGNLRPERFATFVWAADGVVLTLKKARHASDLMKLIAAGPVISCELPDDGDGDSTEDDDCPVPPPPCRYVAATLVSAVASESGDKLLLNVVALSGESLHVTFSADASVDDVVAVILTEWSLGDNTVVRLLTMDGEDPLAKEVLVSELVRGNIGGVSSAMP